MHHPSSPDLIRNTSAMFIFLYKSKKHRRDLSPLFYTSLDSGWGRKQAASEQNLWFYSDHTIGTLVLIISNAVHKCHLLVSKIHMTLQERRKDLMLLMNNQTSFYLFHLNRKIFFNLSSFLEEIISFICFSLVRIEVSWLIFCQSVLRAIKCRLGCIHKETHWEYFIYCQSVPCGIK